MWVLTVSIHLLTVANCNDVFDIVVNFYRLRYIWRVILSSLNTYRNKAFDSSTSATIEIKSSSSVKLVSGSFPVTINFCNITYVTTTPNYATLLIHVHNGYTDTKTVQKVSNYECASIVIVK